MKTVILCGGKGTRMGSGSQDLPKPLFKVGDKPIIWHIMKIFATQGFDDFILCAGYKTELIKKFVEDIHSEGWKVTVVDTLPEFTKSQRIESIKYLIKEDDFFVSYGDDVSDINLNKLLEFHKAHGNTATLTGVKMVSPFGIIDFQNDGLISQFKEKPLLDKWMNGGYMIFKRKIFEYLNYGELEDEVFPKLVGKKDIYLYKSEGAWKSMNTLKDNQELNELWRNKKAFWKIWENG